MICKGVVIYKGIEKRDGGSFKDASGRDINYESAYVVKFDENKDGKINERKAKFPSSNTYLYNKFVGIKAYTEVLLEFDVILTNNSCRLVPINVYTDIPDEYIEE